MLGKLIVVGLMLALFSAQQVSHEQHLMLVSIEIDPSIETI